MVGVQQLWHISVWVLYGVLGVLENGYVIFWSACLFSFSIRYRMTSKNSFFSDADACCLKLVLCDGYLYLHAATFLKKGVTLSAIEIAFSLASRRFYFYHCLVVVA